jgi:hypothetical protein
MPTQTLTELKYGAEVQADLEVAPAELTYMVVGSTEQVAAPAQVLIHCMDVSQAAAAPGLVIIPAANALLIIVVVVHQVL